MANVEKVILMEAWAFKIAGTLIPSIIVAVITSFLAVRLAMRSFISQKWWERKSEAYAAVIEAIYHCLDYADVIMDAETEGTELSGKRRKELATRSIQGRDAIYKAAALGEFVLSDEALDHLKTLRHALNTASGLSFWHEQLIMEIEALGNALDAIRDAAMKDLKVPNCAKRSK